MKGPLSAIHPQLRLAALVLPSFTFTQKNVRQMRPMMRLVQGSRTPAGARVENLFISRSEDQTKLRVRIYRPMTGRANAPALLWFHGGGYMLGAPEQNDSICGYYSRELGLVVLSPAYRLAPEQPFPAALEDGWTALRWAAVHAGELGIDAGRIAIGGASSGGGLAAALCQAVRDRGEVRPAFQLLVYPMLDDRTCLRTDIPHRSNLTWSPASNRCGWEAYLGRSCGERDLPAYAVPARREDLSGLPPAWLGVGTLDLFHDETVEYARRLKEGGIECELQVVPGAFHAFDMAAPGTSLVKQFHRSQVEALKKVLYGGQ